MLTDIVIILSALAVIVALVVAIVTKVISARKNRTEKVVNGIPSGYITMLVIIFTIVVCVVTFFAIPVESMLINGEAYDDGFWLRAANMCIITAIILLIMSVLTVVLSRFVRK